MKKSYFFLLMLLILTGCATVPIVLTPGAEVVRVAKTDPSDNYEEVGPVTGLNGNGCGAFGSLGTYEGAITDLKNRAYGMGGNYVQIFTISEPHLQGECFNNQYIISGTVYKKVRDLPSPTPIVNQSPSNNSLEKMRLLKQMRDEGLITEKQYEEKQQQLLK